ncbi:MAG: tetraacyldisaccharide 4'-kinase, partial [Synergistaceae bacterium]|nr:tetraacyldisaccharide 4'-kinase [Synergistaceae bacterium]
MIDMIFTPLSWISKAAISLMDFMRVHGLTKTKEPVLPLISVGNLTYGGTNKTPFVEMLAEYAVNKGVKTGIVTRGYTGRSKNVTIIRNCEGQRDIAGDEPLLLSRKLPDVPVAISKHRIESVKALKAEGIELVIADDAFQHKSLGRDCDIVLIDSMCPFGSGKITPAGVMRESINALSRADIAVLTKSDMIASDELDSLRELVREYVPDERIFTSRLIHDGWITFGINVNPKKFSKVYAFSAIGSPESFRRSISDYGFILAGEKHYTDHHRYTRSDIEYLCASAMKQGADAMICTEKDLYNLPEQFKWNMNIPLIVPKVKAAVNESERFYEALSECMKPEIIIASNGYGEDAIGVMLAKKLKRKLPESNISAFPLVGKGDAYLQAGFEIKSAPSVTPSGGVVKYSLKDLLGDMRAGLL